MNDRDGRPIGKIRRPRRIVLPSVASHVQVSGEDDAARPDVRHVPDQPHPTARPAPWNLSDAWNIPDDEPDEPGDQARPLATLVSFHYLRAAVRRRWRFCALFALLGVLLAGAYLSANPAPRTATTTLRLTHEEQADPPGAIATDISLLKTRTVAERTIQALGLTMSPEAMMSSVKAVPTGSTEILQLTMSAPTDAEAVRWLNTFAKEYLSFRATQISAQSDVLIKGYKNQINDLQSQAEALRKKVETLASGNNTAADQLTEAVSKLSQVNDKISTLQGTLDDETLRQQAIVLASRVIDPAAPTSPDGMRRMVLVLASGLIGGLAIGFGVIVLRAILSDRLWLRIEVASALNASVLLSVRRIAPLPRLLRIVRWLPWIRLVHARRVVDRQHMARAIENAVPDPGRRQSVGMVCVNNSDEMRFGVVAAAARLQNQERMATIIDLTEAGRVASAAARCADATLAETPTVFRPRVVPSLAEGPTHVDAADWEDVAPANGRNRVAIILADLNPAIGVDHLTAWTDSVIVAVTAGKSSVELVRTAGDLVRSVGLYLRGAVLLGAVRDDMSSGVATPVGEGGSETLEPAVTLPESSVRPPLKP
jgi:capsular polysaccharide biosynthesis protein